MVLEKKNQDRIKIQVNAEGRMCSRDNRARTGLGIFSNRTLSIPGKINELPKFLLQTCKHANSSGNEAGDKQLINPLEDNEENRPPSVCAFTAGYQNTYLQTDVFSLINLAAQAQCIILLEEPIGIYSVNPHVMSFTPTFTSAKTHGQRENVLRKKHLKKCKKEGSFFIRGYSYLT